MKFILIGNSNIGKSALAWRYKYDSYKDYFTSTIGVDVQTKNYQMFNDTEINVLLWDTAGQEKFQALSSIFYRDTIGIYLCFDYTNRKSFLDLPKWLESMIDYLPEYVDIVLVGLKDDLENKQVTEIEAKNFANDNGLSFYSISSKTGKNVDKMFLDRVEKIYVDYKLKRFSIPERLGGISVKENKKKRLYSCIWPW